MAFAHSQNERGEKHDLVAHLEEVATRAAEFAGKFGASDLGYWAGLWHDLGKFHPDFQAYLKDPDARRGPDHKAAGAILASRYLDALCFPIKGHHGGLPSRADLRMWLCEKAKEPRIQDVLRITRQEIPELEPANTLNLPVCVHSPLEAELLLRLLFSALVDADFLDTERHFDPEKTERRGAGPSLEVLWNRLQEKQRALTGKFTDRVNRVRHEVYEACLRAADQVPGFFRLTVPTGGGKTRSGVAFALRHALKHQMDRIVVAIPYTSIIEQTADVYREIFGPDGVLEHHSAVTLEEDPENPSSQEMWRRLAAENWDARIVVTTTVQLFESLFSNKTSQCRKLHNLARSVLILDEVQTLPTRLLEPILDALRQLVAHYGVTVMLCTATQPALEDSPYLSGLPNVREIAPNPARLFTELQRVSYEWPRRGETMSWAEVSEQMQREAQALAVVNTKSDAIALLDALNDPQALHLSTLLCGAHRRAVLEAIRERLSKSDPCRLVSTQVVEAGVDLNFPLVLRAVGPLDRVVQAAGRCNREGHLNIDRARVIVFDPEGAAALPSGEYRTATASTLALLRQPELDFHNPHVYEKYFRQLYQVVELDPRAIQPRRKSLDFPEVARRFRMIEDDTVPVVVRYLGPSGSDHTVDELLARIRQHPAGLSREVLRQLQPYLVSVRTYRVAAYQSDGLIAELLPGLLEWLGEYNPVRGLGVANRDPTELVV